MKRNMNLEININENINNIDKIIPIVQQLFNLYIMETIKGNKVSYYYEDINSSSQLSFNKEICFYAASSIKILVCLILFENAEHKKIDLEQKVLVTMKDIKQGTGIIKLQDKDTEYSILELIKLCLIESDNTAYLKLIDIVGKKNIIKYGKNIGAKYTMIGKENDNFGIVNCEDMILYWKKIKQFIDNSSQYGNVFKKFLLSPTTKLINEKLIDDKKFLRKYGSFDIAYHEAGYVLDDNPYYIIILTQLNKKENKDIFINETAKMLAEIHKKINERS